MVMRGRTIAYGAFLSLLAIRGADAADSEKAAQDRPPLFSRHISAVFSRVGCNGGTCHGAVQGRNGFRLSLFGADPALDHERLLREFSGRRLNLADAEASLLLLKATGQVAHGGGKRIEPGGPEYRILRRWIAAGAPLDNVDRSRVAHLRITPDLLAIVANIPKGILGSSSIVWRAWAAGAMIVLCLGEDLANQ